MQFIVLNITTEPLSTHGLVLSMAMMMCFLYSEAIVARFVGILAPLILVTLSVHVAVFLDLMFLNRCMDLLTSVHNKNSNGIATWPEE